MIISIIALFAAIGGGYAVAKNSDKKSDKKIANKQITKRAPKLSVLHAKTADLATNVSSIQTFSKSGTDNTVTTLAENDQWRVVGLCDPNNDFNVSGFDNGYNGNGGTAIGIVNKSEQHATTDTSDDNDTDFNPGEGVAFNSFDYGDQGVAIAPDGHAVLLSAGGSFDNDSTSTDPGFTGGDCHFAGSATFV